MNDCREANKSQCLALAALAATVTLASCTITPVAHKLSVQTDNLRAPSCPDFLVPGLAASLGIDKLVMTSATHVDPDGNTPAHCRVEGEINRRIGIDGQSYAIRFRARLPVIGQWNQRFFMGGGGGTNGVLIDPVEQLKLGYATIGTDGGHDNQLNNRASAGGIASFGADPQARRDFAYNAYDLVTQTGKRLVQAHYGRPAQHAYFMGCSEGGREAMLMSQRFAHHYDGVVAGDPVLHLPLGPMAGIRTTQLFARLAEKMGQKHADGEPALGKTYSDLDLMLVRDAVLAACDALDGLVDGSVENLPSCTTARVMPELYARQCLASKTESCLSTDQIQALETAYAGVVDSKGRRLYPTWPWDGGIGGRAGQTYNQAWRSWWLGSFDSTTNNAIKLRFSTPLAVAYATPPILPMTVGDSLRYSLAYDFDRDPDRLYVTSGLFNESAAQLFFTDNPDLGAFKARKGKIILYHGASDSAVSMHDTVDWYQAVSARYGTETPSFARLFLVPGMGHCRGGPATDSFDMLTPLVQWVEQGIAPEHIIATANTPAYFGVPARSRPLCPYPLQARYRGQGDINDANNFQCLHP
jgi:Tannase and feruloyl esterase